MAGGAQPKIRCPNCSSDVPFGSKFCPNCGTNIGATVTCPECKATLPAGSKFCPNCGHNMTAPAAAPAEQPAADTDGDASEADKQ
jgi:rRNA maturation endonuclease Nob1